MEKITITYRLLGENNARQIICADDISAENVLNLLCSTYTKPGSIGLLVGAEVFHVDSFDDHLTLTNYDNCVAFMRAQLGYA